MSGQIFIHRHRVTYSECTLGNHVYYARYLDILEAARGEFFRAAGAALPELEARGFIFPVIECRLRYHAPARYDDTLAVEVRLAELGRVRLTFTHRILNPSGALIAEAGTTHVCTGVDEKPKRLAPDVLEKLNPFLAEPRPADNA